MAVTTERCAAAPRLAPWVGLALTVVLVALAFALPRLLDWDVAARAPRSASDLSIAPLHGIWEPKWFGPGTVPAVVIALLGWRYAVDLAARLGWRRLLATSYVVSLAWMLALAFVDGPSGISRAIGDKYEYLPTARATGSVSVLLHEYISRIGYESPDNWPTHVAGHPPGMLLFFVGLVRVGLGGAFAAGIVVTVVAATTAVAVLVTLRALGAEEMARRAAPFLVLAPAAVFMAVSADAVIGAVAAWGLACLALGATSVARGRTRAGGVAWSVLAGLVLGCGTLMSYGLPLIGLVAVAILLAARSWWPLPIAAVCALAVVLVFAALGFAWWEAYPVLTDRYWDGIAADRPASYWLWGNLAALAVSAGPLLGAALAHVAVVRRGTGRAVLLLTAAAVLVIVIADASRMSKAEVERIWLPFIPWLMVAIAALPEVWRRRGVGLQVVFAVVVQQLLYTSW